MFKVEIKELSKKESKFFLKWTVKKSNTNKLKWRSIFYSVVWFMISLEVVGTSEICFFSTFLSLLHDREWDALFSLNHVVVIQV